MKFPKHDYIRSPQLLAAARMIECQHCGIDDGTVVAAHTNWGGGKGRGIKADDNLIASLCSNCHFQIDQGAVMSKQQRMVMWIAAHYKTVRKLVMLGLWADNVPIPHNPEFDEILKDAYASN
jgi:hypothetical protein